MLCPNCEKKIKAKIVLCPYCGCRFPVKESQEEFSKKHESQIYLTPPMVEEMQDKKIPLRNIEKQEVIQEVFETEIGNVGRGVSQKVDIRLCKICGKQINLSAKFCKYCGTKISDLQEHAPIISDSEETKSINEKEQEGIMPPLMEEEQNEDAQKDKSEVEIEHTEQNETDTKFCKNCGKKIAYAAVFCRYCGKRLTK